MWLPALAVRQPLEKEAHLAPEELRKAPERRGADAIGAALVLLHLLESQAEPSCEALLTQTQGFSAEADHLPHVRIYRLHLSLIASAKIGPAKPATAMTMKTADRILR